MTLRPITDNHVLVSWLNTNFSFVKPHLVLTGPGARDNLAEHFRSTPAAFMRKTPDFGGLITILLMRGLDPVSKLESTDSELDLMEFV